MPPRKSIKTVTVSSEPVFVEEDGKQVPYIPGEIVTHRDAYAASLHIMFKHVADFHILMIDILAEKYNLDAHEIVKTVQQDERFQTMVIHPVVNSLSYFGAEDAKKHIDVPVGGASDKEVDELIAEIDKLSIGDKESVEEAPPAPAPEPKKKKVVVRKAKKADA